MPAVRAAGPPSALQPSRAALAALLDGIDDALLLVDDVGNLSFCNRAAMRRLGAEPGRGLDAIAPCGRRAPHKDPRERMLQTSTLAVASGTSDAARLYVVAGLARCF